MAVWIRPGQMPGPNIALVDAPRLSALCTCPMERDRHDPADLTGWLLTFPDGTAVVLGRDGQLLTRTTVAAVIARWAPRAEAHIVPVDPAASRPEPPVRSQ